MSWASEWGRARSGMKPFTHSQEPGLSHTRTSEDSEMGSGQQARALLGQGRQPRWQTAAQAQLQGWAGSPHVLSYLSPEHNQRGKELWPSLRSPGLRPWPGPCLHEGPGEFRTPLCVSVSQ